MNQRISTFSAVIAGMACGLIALLTACGTQEVEGPALGAGRFEVTVFDLKQHGLATVHITPSGAAYLVDCGPKRSGRDIIIPFLKAKGIERIQGIVVSHSDDDHWKGLPEILKAFPVETIWHPDIAESRFPKSFKKLLRKASKEGCDIKQLGSRNTLAWDEALSVSVLAPPKDPIKTKKKNFDNDHSIVLRITHGKVVILLPGDIEDAGAKSLMARAQPLSASVLIAPHHGFFDNVRFAAAVNPRHVIVPCMSHYEDKKPSKPGDQARSLFGAVGAKVLVTGEDGTVTIQSDGVKVEVTARGVAHPTPRD